MLKSILSVLITFALIVLFTFGIYKGIEYLDYKSSISNLEKYTFSSNEKIVKSFKYNKYNYLLTMYYDDTSSWSHLNLLLLDNEEYYLLKNIQKCDSSVEGRNLYLKDNEIYIHCIGKMGDIDKYTLDKINVKKETFNFNYDDTPNISQLHINIDKVDDKYIYLYSFKVDSLIKEGENVKCSLKNNTCEYYQ